MQGKFADFAAVASDLRIAKAHVEIKDSSSLGSRGISL
jgi:hypothetical protein